MIRIPVTASSMPEWVRKAGGTVNDLISKLLALTVTVVAAEADIATLQGDVITLDGRVDALEVDIVALEAYIVPPVNLEAYKVTARSVSSAPTILGNDTVIGVDATTGALAVNLPALSGNEGRVLVIKKMDASANVVTVDGNGTETVDGAAAAVITVQWQTITVVAGPSGWWII